MTKKYTTNLKFCRFLGITNEYPNRQQTTWPAKDNFGTGDGSTLQFELSTGNIVENSETIYYGSSESAATTSLTRTTHYTINYDSGILTLTTAGKTLLSTNKMYGKYSYINQPKPTDTQISEAIERAESEVDSRVSTVFFDGTAATPNFGIVTDEVQDGQGKFSKVYTCDEYPVYNATTTLNGAVSADDTTITVVSTSGFPSSGTFACENDKIAYTGKTTTDFTGCTSVEAHDDEAVVTSFVVERALDDEGNSPTFTVMAYLSDYDLDFLPGEVRLNNVSLAGTTILDNFSPPRGVWNRVRLSYQYGHDTIPERIIKCVHYIAASELFGAQMLNALSRGTNGFNSDGYAEIKDWINKTIAKYHVVDVKCTQP